jgi:hypothetical protein
MPRCLNGKSIDVQEFFNISRSPVAFPWDLVGLSRPKVGTIHAYLGRAIAQFAESPAEKNIIANNPSLSQLQNIQKALSVAGEGSAPMIGFILDAVSKVDGREHLTLEQKVLIILSECPPFVNFVKKTLTALWINGKIELDDKYFLLAGENTYRRSQYFD